MNAEEILGQVEADASLCRKQYPDEKACLHGLVRLKSRMEELGWKDVMYAPKDGSVFLVCQFGSCGVFECVYHGEWPEGHFMVMDGGDVYPTTTGVLMWKT